MSSLSPAPSRQPDLECGPASQTTPPQQRRPISTTLVTVFLLPMPSQQSAKSVSSSVCKQQTSLGCASRTLIPNGRKTHDALPAGSYSLQRRLALGRAGWVRNPRSREKWKRGVAAKRDQTLLRLTPAGLGPQGLSSPTSRAVRPFSSHLFPSSIPSCAASGREGGVVDGLDSFRAWTGWTRKTEDGKKTDALSLDSAQPPLLADGIHD